MFIPVFLIQHLTSHLCYCRSEQVHILDYLRNVVEQLSTTLKQTGPLQISKCYH